MGVPIEKESRFTGIHPFGTFFAGHQPETRQSHEVDGLFSCRKSPFKNPVK
jgi:hypothetical protein